MQQKPIFSLKLFATVLVSTLFITAFSHLGPLAYERVFQEEDRFTEGTFIGLIDVQGLQEKDAVSKINEAITNWQKNTVITLSFSDQSIEIPGQMYRFQVEESVASAESGITNPLYLVVKEQDLKEQLATMVDEEALSFINIDGLRAKLEEFAGTLPSKETTLKLTDYMDEEYVVKKEILSQAEVLITEREQLSQWLESHGEVVIPAKTNFSLLMAVKDEQSIFTNEFLSKIASGIYETVLSTNIEVVERHKSKEFPSGIEPGFEAKIVKEKMDLIVYNPNDSDITFQFKEKNMNAVTVITAGLKTGMTYKVRLENKKTYEPKRIIQYVADQSQIKKGQEKEGKDGYSVSVYQDVYDSKGELLQSSLVSEDFYLPVNEVEIKVIEEPEAVEEETQDDENVDSVSTTN